ncbi:helix-turn-helix transcriptional regulator [bacterium]|nr:helix-turn-helix transcriptional regulator [bacterium]
MEVKSKSNEQKKELLLKAIGDVVAQKRKIINKGILLLSYEYDIPNTSLAKLEKGKRDVQITTLWRLAEALGCNTFSEFVKEVEKNLPKNFKLTED